MPGLDGLRALAVAAVLAYHGRIPGVDAGFIGISVFFTLSGFLITSILLREHDRSGRIDLWGFWARRYRRLLPAAFLTLAGVVVFGATVATEQQLDDLPAGVTAAVAQVANWFFVASDRSYVELFSAPSPVQHFWSLAVEEQFYLALPLAMVPLLRICPSRRVLAAVLGGAALASTALLVSRYEAGASLDRLYYGTDTRAAELLVGAALAAALAARRLSVRVQARRVLALTGVAGLLALGWACSRLTFGEPLLWRGGFLLTALATAVLIVVVLDGANPVTRVLSIEPLPAIGRISYGLYLFHWPVFLWLTEERTGLDTAPLFLLRLAVTVPITVASYHLLEMPIRNRTLAGARRRLPLALAPAAVVVVAGGFLVAQRDVETDLAGLGETAAAPRLAPTDTVLDLLVLADEAGQPLASDLAQSAESDPALNVTVEAFACGNVERTTDGPVCQQAGRWAELVEQSDPDLVLLQANGWSEDPAAGLDKAAALELTTALLADGFDRLTSSGARVVWNQAAAGDMREELRRTGTAFSRAMERLTVERRDATETLYLPDDPESLVAELAVHARPADEALPRVLVVGDSGAATLGHGLQRWAADAGTAIVWSAATEGCGLFDEGTVTDRTGRSVELPELCRDVGSVLASQVEQFDPDVVVVLSTIFDLRQRRFGQGDQLLRPGDPDFDERLLAAYEEVAETLSARGATVVWLTSPCAEDLLDVFPDPQALDPERIRHVNDVILRQLENGRPEVELFDLFSVLCTEERGGREGPNGLVLRPDGYHFSAEGSRWLADNYGDQLIAPA